MQEEEIIEVSKPDVQINMPLPTELDKNMSERSTESKSSRRGRQKIDFTNRKDFNSSEVSSVLELLQQSNRISVKQVQYFQIHRSVQKALDTQPKEDEILDLISEMDEEAEEKESVYSVYGIGQKKRLPFYEGTAFVYQLFGFVFFAILVTSIKLLGINSIQSLNFMETTAFRGFFLIVLSFVQQRFQHIETLKLQEKNQMLLIFAMIFGGFTILFEVAAIYQMQISHFIIIFSIQPVLSAFMNFFVNGHTLTRLELISLLSCFAGVMILTRPDIIPQQQSKENQDEKEVIKAQMDLFGITLSLVSSLCSGTHHALMRKAGYRIHTTHNVMMVGIFVTLISCVFMPIFDFRITPLQSQMDLILLLFIGVLGYITQYCFSLSQQYEKPECGNLFIVLPIALCFYLDYQFLTGPSGMTDFQFFACGFILVFTLLNSFLMLFEPSPMSLLRLTSKFQHNLEKDLLLQPNYDRNQDGSSQPLLQEEQLLIDDSTKRTLGKSSPRRQKSPYKRDTTL